MTTQSEAIIIKSIPYSEADLIVTFLTASLGKCAGLARSAKKSQKRFPGGFNSGTLVNMQFIQKAGRDLVTIESHDMVLMPPMSSIEQVAASGIGIELVDRFIPLGQDCTDKFPQIKEYITTLHESRSLHQDLVRFCFTLLKFAGFHPVFSHCVVCGNESSEDWGFDDEEGGVRCRSCMPHSGMMLSNTVREAIVSAIDTDSGVEVGAPLMMAGSLLKRYIIHVLGKPLRSEAYWQMMGIS